jgi:hypothetical protein
VRLGRVERRDAEREAFAALDVEACLRDQQAGIAPEVTAAGKVRPNGGIGGALECPRCAPR